MRALHNRHLVCANQDRIAMIVGVNDYAGGPAAYNAARSITSRIGWNFCRRPRPGADSWRLFAATPRHHEMMSAATAPAMCVSNGLRLRRRFSLSGRRALTCGGAGQSPPHTPYNGRDRRGKTGGVVFRLERDAGFTWNPGGRAGSTWPFSPHSQSHRNWISEIPYCSLLPLSSRNLRGSA